MVRTKRANGMLVTPRRTHGLHKLEARVDGLVREVEALSAILNDQQRRLQLVEAVARPTTAADDTD